MTNEKKEKISAMEFDTRAFIAKILYIFFLSYFFRLFFLFVCFGSTVLNVTYVLKKV